MVQPYTWWIFSYLTSLETWYECLYWLGLAYMFMDAPLCTWTREEKWQSGDEQSSWDTSLHTYISNLAFFIRGVWLNGTLVSYGSVCTDAEASWCVVQGLESHLPYHSFLTWLRKSVEIAVNLSVCLGKGDKISFLLYRATVRSDTQQCLASAAWEQWQCSKRMGEEPDVIFTCWGCMEY